MNINVHIERLVLEGIDIAHRQRPLLQTAVEAEMARLLAADGLASGLLGGGAMPHVRGGNVQLTGQASAADLGRQIAQAVYGGIGR